MTWLVKVALERPYTFIVMALMILIFGPLAAVRTFRFDAETLRTRASGDMTACGGGELGLRVPLTPDSPATAPVYDIDIFDDCFVYPQARMDNIRSVDIDVARLSRNYGLAHDQSKVKAYPQTSRFGELKVYLDSCDGGQMLAQIPLGDPATTPNRQTVTAQVPAQTGIHNLCLVFASPISGAFYGIGQVQLKP